MKTILIFGFFGLVLHSLNAAADLNSFDVLPAVLNFPPGTTVTSSGKFIVDPNFDFHADDNKHAFTSHRNAFDWKGVYLVTNGTGSINSVATLYFDHVSIAKIDKEGIQSVTTCDYKKATIGMSAQRCATATKNICAYLLRVSKSKSFDDLEDKLNACKELSTSDATSEALTNSVLKEENDNLRNLGNAADVKSDSATLTKSYLEKKGVLDYTYFHYLNITANNCKRMESVKPPTELKVIYERRSGTDGTR